MAGRLTLNQLIVVRVHVGQPASHNFVLTLTKQARYRSFMFYGGAALPIDGYIAEVRSRLQSVLPAHILEPEIERLSKNLRALAAQICEQDQTSKIESESRAVMQVDPDMRLPRTILKRYNPVLGVLRLRTWMAIGYLLGIGGLCFLPAWSDFFRTSGYHWASVATALIGFGAVAALAYRFRIVAGKSLLTAVGVIFISLVVSAPWVSAYGEFGRGLRFRWVTSEDNLANRHVITMLRVIDRQVNILRQGKLAFTQGGEPTREQPWYLPPGQSPGSLERFGFNAVSYDDNNERPRWIAPAYWYSFRYFGNPSMERDVEYYAYPSFNQARKRWISASEMFEKNYAVQKASLQSELLMVPSPALPDFSRLTRSMPFFAVTAIFGALQMALLALMARWVAIMYKPRKSEW